MASLAHLFRQRVDRSPDLAALWFRSDSGQLTAWTWRQLDDEVSLRAGALQQLGVDVGDRVAHWSPNCPQWIVTDLALQRLGAVHVPIHAPLSWQQADFQAKDCGAKLVIVDSSEKAAALADQGHTVVAYQSDSQRLRSDRKLASGAGETIPGGEVTTILYTSGTTGEPKGVMLSVDNLVTNATTMEMLFGDSPKRRIGFLPLSHIFARTCDLYTWVVGGGELALAQSRETVLRDCAEFEPETLNGVPYFFQKVQAQVESGVDIRQLLGSRVRYCCSGGAPLPVATYDFFQQLGVPVLQGYGLTETSPVIAACTPELDRRGSVGKPIPGTEARTDDGEIQVRGPHVMKGYYGHPAQDPDKWFATGDLGRIDDDGYLYVTGRRKELIVLSTGKNVAPTMIESRLVAHPLIEQAMVIGNDRSFLTALVCPSAVAAERHGGAELTTAIDAAVADSLSDLGRHEQVRRNFLLPRPFSMETGELTPKLSLKREAIEANWSEAIESLYKD